MTTPKWAGIKWRENYSCYNTMVNEWLRLTFSWHSDGYHITVAERKLKAQPTDPKKAAELAVQAAIVWLRKAADDLEKAYAGKS